MIETPDKRNTASEATEGPNDLVLPWAKIKIAEPDPWVEPEAFDRNIPANNGAHLTYLLHSRQHDAELEKIFFSTAVRLETAIAVQNESQWRVNLEPRFQDLTIHWLRVVRNGEQIDHLKRDRMRLLQRETQLEHHVISGSWTLMVVLTDVRPGDLIESGYTLATKHPIASGWCENFFSVPSQIVVGCFRCSVLFDADRPNMAWKGSVDAPDREEKVLPDGRRMWLWKGSQTTLRELEPNVPGSHLDFVWMQYSDIASWRVLAGKIADAWTLTASGFTLATFPEFTRPANVERAAVHGLVRQIQENYRYLSMDLSSCGCIPATPEVIARQRFGDCKDLVWLAHMILLRWGVKARPILVGSGLRSSVADFLPTIGLFNHAVLEVSIDGMARWFDLTERNQGGNFSTQPVGWFGFGLPLGLDSGELLPQPGAQVTNVHALRETLVVDTRKGEESLIEIRLWAEGYQADGLRNTRARLGPDGHAKERLHQAQQRHGKVDRVGALLWRDNREKNICEIVEVFSAREIYSHGEGNRAIFEVPRNGIATNFPVPDEKPRRNPWHMPYPIDARHSWRILGRSLGSANGPRRKWKGPWFTTTLDEPRASGEWSKTTRFVVHTPAIRAQELSEYRVLLADIQQASSWRLYLPWRIARPSLPDSFGKLAPVEQGVSAYVGATNPEDYPPARIGEITQTGMVKPGWRGWLRGPRNTREIFLVVWILIILSGMVRACTDTS
ncbi:MAG TPA: DUF3857 domain-containing protein [Lacunisphaera sp.]|jgi:hypothetical protein